MLCCGSSDLNSLSSPEHRGEYGTENLQQANIRCKYVEVMGGVHQNITRGASIDASETIISTQTSY